MEATHCLKNQKKLVHPKLQSSYDVEKFISLSDMCVYVARVRLVAVAKTVEKIRNKGEEASGKLHTCFMSGQGILNRLDLQITV